MGLAEAIQMVQKRKQEMEKELLESVRKFETETGTRVDNVYIRRDRTMCSSFGNVCEVASEVSLSNNEFM
jgi:hypothetical protein